MKTVGKIVQVEFSIEAHFSVLLDLSDKNIVRLLELINSPSKTTYEGDGFHKILVNQVTSESFSHAFKCEDVEVYEADILPDYPFHGTKRISIDEYVKKIKPMTPTTSEPENDWQASPKKQKPLPDKLDSVSFKLKDVKAQRIIKDEKGLPIGFEPFNKPTTEPKTAEQRWTIVRMLKQDVLMDNGVISAISMEEICDLLNQTAQLQEQLKESNENIKMLKQAMKNGSEMYADLRFDDEPFTPYQIALQQLKEKDQLISELVGRWEEIKRGVLPLDSFESLIKKAGNPEKE